MLAIQYSAGDNLVLATDGLWDVLDATEVLSATGSCSCGSGQEVADALLSAAVAKGVSDNLTVLVVQPLKESVTDGSS